MTDGGRTRAAQPGVVVQCGDIVHRYFRCCVLAPMLSLLRLAECAGWALEHLASLDDDRLSLYNS